MRKLPENLKLKPWFTFRATEKQKESIIKKASKFKSVNDYLLNCHETKQAK